MVFVVHYQKKNVKAKKIKMTKDLEKILNALEIQEKTKVLDFLIDKNNKSDNKTIANSVWEKANCLTDFCSPWSDNLFSKIEFADFLIDSYFNFLYSSSFIFKLNIKTKR